MSTVTLADAAKNVQLLEQLPLPDLQPGIEGHHRPIAYAARVDCAYSDATALCPQSLKWSAEMAEQARCIGELSSIVTAGEWFRKILYTWRCVYRGIPAIETQDQANRHEIYRATVELLGPEVEKLRALMKFINGRAIHEFVSTLSKAKDMSQLSDGLLHSLGEMVDMFYVIDELKNSRSGVKNDYSGYKRTCQHLKMLSDKASIEESHTLSMFLATNYIISDSLKAEVQRVPGYDVVLGRLINYSATQFTSNRLIFPHERSLHIRVLAFSLFLLDHHEVTIYKLDSKKVISLARLDKIFKQLEVVGLYGDMTAVPFSYLQRRQSQSGNFDASSWPLMMSSSVTGPQATTLSQSALAQCRADYANYLLALSLTRVCDFSPVGRLVSKKPSGGRCHTLLMCETTARCQKRRMSTRRRCDTTTTDARSRLWWSS